MVSFLELFYDLVYVVLIGRASHHLAEHVDGAGVADFVVVFGLIWLAWFNGTLWHELHGREDGRSRRYIFLQMGLLALLAVFAGEATAADGPPFAVTYAVLFALLTWQWYLVHRIDDRRTYRPTTSRCLAGMLATAVAVGRVPSSRRAARLALGGGRRRLGDRRAGPGRPRSTPGLRRRRGPLVRRSDRPLHDHRARRGLGGGRRRHPEPGPDGSTIATGMIVPTIGLGMWWAYFDCSVAAFLVGGVAGSPPGSTPTCR